MRIEGTALQADIAMVTSDVGKATHYGYDVFVKGGGSQVMAMKMESLNEERNYGEQYGDNAVVVLWFVEKDYNATILPNVKDLEIIITKRQLNKPNKLSTGTGDAVTTRYKGTLVDVTVPQVGESNLYDHDPANAMKRVTVQLMDRALYQMRLTTIGGVFRATTPGEVLSVMLTSKSQTIEIDESSRPLGVEMVPPDTALKSDGTANLRDHVIVRGGVPLFDLAGYLQQHCGGIYNNGIGCYYQSSSRVWHVYPLFDNNRANTSDRTLTIIRVPADSMPDVDNSYTLRGSHLFVLGTDEAISIDQTDHHQLNDGNASIYPTATGVMSKIMPASDSAGFTNQSDVLGRISVTDRPDGLNSAKFDVRAVTDNSASVISKLARATQQLMQFGWAYSDPSLLYPGMPVKVLYDNNGIIQTLQGTLIGGDSFTELATPGMATIHYQTKTALTVLVDKPPEKRA